MPKPYWVQHRLPEPPVVNGYHDYGVVWVEGQQPPVETFRERFALVRWSYRTWAVKVWKECRGIHYGKVKDQSVT